MSNVAILDQAKLLDSQWQIMLASMHQSLTLKTQVEKTLIENFGDQGRYCISGWDIESGKLSRVFHSMADIIIRSLTSSLQTSTGCAPTIEYSHEQENTYGEEPSYRDLAKHRDFPMEAYHLAVIDYARTRSIEAYATSLIAAYSPEKATALALSEAACVVNDYFARPHWKKEPVIAKSIKDRLVLEADVYWDSYDSWRLGTGCRTRLFKLMTAMCALLHSAGQQGAIYSTEDFSFLANHGRYTSRERFECGPGLDLVVFKDKIQFHFQPGALEAIQIAANEHRMENAA